MKGVVVDRSGGHRYADETSRLLSYGSRHKDAIRAYLGDGGCCHCCLGMASRAQMLSNNA